MKQFCALLLLLVIVSYCARSPSVAQHKYTSPLFSQTDRETAVLRALSFLEEQARNHTQLQETGHEYLVGLYMLKHRFNNQTISERVERMAHDAIARWSNEIFPQPERQIQNISTASTVLSWVQMLAMQIRFNSTPVYRKQLTKAIVKRSKQLQVYKYFSFEYKSARDRSTYWTKPGSFCMDLIYSFFTHIANMEHTIGISFTDIFASHFFKYRSLYDSLSFQNNVDLYMNDFKAYMKFHDLIYAVTHYCYTLSGYTGQPLPIKAFAQEFEFLRANLPLLVHRIGDPDIIGEVTDSLIILGGNHSDPVIQEAVAFLLNKQDSKGFFGGPTHPLFNHEEVSNLEWFHSTMAAMFALRDVQFNGSLPELPFKDIIRVIETLSD